MKDKELAINPRLIMGGKIKFKQLHPSAVLPFHAKPGDAGMDLTVVDIRHQGLVESRHHYGLAVEIPEGYVGLLFPRSSVCNTSNRLSNSVGVLDSGYRGEIMAVFDSVENGLNGYKKGDRTAQIVIVPFVTVQSEWAEELTETERGEGGYGSTNIK